MSEHEADESAGAVRIHQSLLQPRLMAGLPEKMTVGIWVLTVAFVLQGVLWVGLLSLVIHLVLARAFKRDPHILEVTLRALRAPRRLDP